jgi:hypothetical protein
MRIKTDVKPLNWTGVEHPRSATQLRAFPHTIMLTPPSTGVVSGVKHRAYLQKEPGSLLELRDLLRNEIIRGDEYLAQVQNDLHENRELLEQWAQYEVTCSFQPLDHLVQLVLAKESVEQFLINWLKRRRNRLATVLRKLKTGRGNPEKPRLRH